MDEKIIVCDTRERKNKKILEYFDKIGQDYIVSKLDAGDYMIFKHFKTIIDKKDGLLELSHNLSCACMHPASERMFITGRRRAKQARVKA